MKKTFQTPGAVRLVLRVPDGRVELETVEGSETTVELEASDEVLEEARIELRERAGGYGCSSRSIAQGRASSASGGMGTCV